MQSVRGTNVLDGHAIAKREQFQSGALIGLKHVPITLHLCTRIRADFRSRNRRGMAGGEQSERALASSAQAPKPQALARLTHALTGGPSKHEPPGFPAGPPGAPAFTSLALERVGGVLQCAWTTGLETEPVMICSRTPSIWKTWHR